MQNNSAKPKIELKRRAHLYALDVIKFIDTLGKRDISVMVIARQLLRSATSIGANIIEAQAGSMRRDCTNFLSHALKSANESKFWLGLLRDSGKAERGGVEALLQETTEIANILGSSIITLKGRRKL